MPEGLGISFAPTGRDRMQDAIGGGPLQEAIQTIALRLPRVAGARQPIPQELLAAGPGQGLGNSVVEAILASILGPQARQPNMGMFQPGVGAPVNPVQQAVSRFMPPQGPPVPGAPPMPETAPQPPRVVVQEPPAEPPPPPPQSPGGYRPPPSRPPFPRDGEGEPWERRGVMGGLPLPPGIAPFPRDPRTDWPSVNWPRG